MEEKNIERWRKYMKENWSCGSHNSEYYSNWIMKNRERKNWHTRMRRARRKNASGEHSLEQWEQLKKQFNYTCPMCGKKEPEIRLTEDHIIPLSKGGTNNIDNIQPLCLRCNSHKYTSIIFLKPISV